MGLLGTAGDFIHGVGDFIGIDDVARDIDDAVSGKCKGQHAAEESWFGKIAGGAGCGLLGYKLGENFGTIGKIAGGVAGAWLGSSLGQQVQIDVAAANDSVKASDGKLSRFKAVADNLLDTTGQQWTGNSNFDSLDNPDA